MKSQEELLLSLIQGDDGLAWASKKVGWKISNNNQENNACTWEGVECSPKNQVIAILIPSTGFSGSLPSEIGELTELENILMEKNQIFGSIPSAIAALPKLIYFDLSDNRLTGTLPTFMSNQLTNLDLGNNNISGPIPQLLFSDTSNSIIEELTIPNNRLSGVLPSSIADMIRLNTLDLSNNLIYGTIPHNLGKLHFLEHLHLNDNNLVGYIPYTLGKSYIVNQKKIGSLLKSIHMEGNKLSGTIPSLLADINGLQEFYIHNNKLTGEVPKDLCSSSLNKQFFQSATSIADHNYCDAIACPVDEVALNVVYPCTKCLNYHYNPYIGNTAGCAKLVNQRDLLLKFYEKTNILDNWVGDVNWDDKTFLCDFTGISCDNNYHVTEINLKGRGLTGTIPDEIGFLPYLEVLDLSDNKLSGFLPSDLRLAPLIKLDVSGNRIMDIIPPKLCLKDGINGNGEDEKYDCDFISCSAGTYSSIGRRDDLEGIKCVPCKHDNLPFIGSKSCYNTGISSAVVGVIIAIGSLVIVAVFFIGTRIYLRRKQSSSLAFQKEQRPIMDKNHPDPQDLPMHRQLSRVTSKQSTKRGAPKKKYYDMLNNDEVSVISDSRSTGSYRISDSGSEAIQFSPRPKRGSNESDGISVGTGSSNSSRKKDVWLDVPKI